MESITAMASVIPRIIKNDSDSMSRIIACHVFVAASGSSAQEIHEYGGSDTKQNRTNDKDLHSAPHSIGIIYCAMIVTNGLCMNLSQ